MLANRGCMWRNVELRGSASYSGNRFDHLFYIACAQVFLPLCMSLCTQQASKDSMLSPTLITGGPPIHYKLSESQAADEYTIAREYWAKLDSASPHLIKKREI